MLHKGGIFFLFKVAPMRTEKNFKETRSVTMNIFRKKKYFLLKSFVKIEFSYVFTINILNYKRNPSVTTRGNNGNQNLEMKIYLYHIL